VGRRYTEEHLVDVLLFGIGQLQRLESHVEQPGRLLVRQRTHGLLTGTPRVVDRGSGLSQGRCLEEMMGELGEMPLA
jgi:hypothetical protein